MSIKNIDIIKTNLSFQMVGDGFRVCSLFPSETIPYDRTSPFVLFDYHPSFYYSPTSAKRGVGVHPHKGFETVTIAFEGKIAHHDSAGNSGIIGPGEVQWMTASSGILHAEYHEKEFAEKGGNLKMCQLWVNLPAKHKSSKPGYQSISTQQIQHITLENNAGEMKLIAGEFNKVKGPAQTFTPIHLSVTELNNNSTQLFSFPQHYNTLLLVTKGSITINNKEEISENEFAVFKNEGTDFTITSHQKSEFLLLSGEPINEPMAQYGPFVMNTQEEIREAILEFNQGKFGTLQFLN